MACRTKMVTIIDMGIAMTDISVVRMSIRKKKSTTITNIAPSKSDCCRLLTELSIKSACRNMSVDILMFFGSEGASCASFASMAFVRRVVDAPVCLLTVSSIASLPLSPAAPIRGVAPPRSITAISLNVTGVPALALSLPTIFTTVSPSSSARLVAMFPFTRYSFPKSLRLPPEEFVFNPSQAANTSSRDIP